MAETDAVRLLGLVSAALEATANGAQPQIQLELVLIKAAAPQMDPSTQALLARIERLEARLEGDRPAAPPQPAAAESTRPAAAAPPPEPAPQPPAPPAPPGGSDLDSIAALWPAVVDTVRGNNALLAALLQGARPIAVNERELTLAFSPDAAFMKRKAEQDDYRRTAADALRNVTGQALALRYELSGPESGDAAAKTAVATVEVSDEELVRRFVEQLDAQEIEETEDGEEA
jgi:DNA polymerase-3 subunit gamma/tau